MISIVDASVVVKWFVEEEGSAEAAAVMRMPLVAPDFLVLECLNVLAGKVRRGMLQAHSAARAAETLGRSGITFEPTLPLAAEILSLSLRLSHPAYDCAYLAVARKLGGTLITADRKLVARCRRADALELGLRVRSLFDGPPMVRERPARPYIPRRKKAA